MIDEEPFYNYLYFMNKRFDAFSPTDFRYSVENLKPYLSEDAFVKYKAKVEVALTNVLAKRGFCSKKVVKELEKAASTITAEKVYKEEKRIKHDIRALVNVLKKRTSKKVHPFIHLYATSYDIVDTANVLRFKDATEKVILPDMIKLEKIWIQLAKREKNTLQIGRTHGQHAEPITFGFAIALYVERWGERIISLEKAKDSLVGKFSGAVGAYNSLRLFFPNPEEFEKEVMDELDLKPAKISSQIVLPEPLTDFIYVVVSSFSVLANFCDDMRHLQRSEIEEIFEAFEEKQVGSSTMPQKRNPINFENVKSMWKEFMPRMITVFMDQISEHQRDLTNSCSQRYLPELLVAFDSSIRRLVNVCSKLKVDKERMRKNFEMNKDKIISEPLYILLSSLGHPDAHEYVRQKIQESYAANKSFLKIISNDETIKEYLKKMNPQQKKIIFEPTKYIGIASKKAEKIASFWEKKLLLRGC